MPILLLILINFLMDMAEEVQRIMKNSYCAVYSDTFQILSCLFHNKIKHTRAMVSAALNGDLEEVVFHPHPIFQVLVPEIVPGVPKKILESVFSNATIYMNIMQVSHMLKDLNRT